MASVLKTLKMKTQKNSSKTVIVMFWSVPSCTTLKAYKEKCSKLNQAVNQFKSVEVVTKDNQTKLFKSIGNQSGTFFGIEDLGARINKTILNINNIKMVTIL